MSSDDDCIRFEQFVSLLHSISKVQSRHKTSPRNSTRIPRSLDLVNQWISDLKQHHSILPPHTCKVFFRLFLPEEDVRRRYNLKETTLARTLATSVFGIATNPQDVSKCRLMEWADYSDARDTAKQGCLGVEVEKTVASRYSLRQAKSRSIQTIDSLLDELASLSAFSDLGYLRSNPRRSRASILRDLYLDLDPFEAKVITQVILKDLRPVLYPLVETHTTKALLHYNSNALHALSKWEVMAAWHSRMPGIYRVRATLDEASRTVEGILSSGGSASDRDMCLPVLGIPIEIPKSQKGTNLSHALSFFQDENEVWVETKYDGERMQIHVDLSRPPSQQITIFSKSKRNSTQDRMGTHPIIRASLGLPPYADDYLRYPTLEERVRTRTIDTPCLTSAILDAEMVCYSESKGDVDEFWRIRSLIESSARGVRGSRCHGKSLVHVQDPQSQNSTECKFEASPEDIPESLQSNASDSGDRHLSIVFFDILFLNGCSLLNRSYRERREQLEQLINVISGFSSLSWRQCIKSYKGSMAVKHLAHIFSQHIANYQEGLVLKGSRSTYNDLQHPWVKLKRDYIPGYGDTVDLVIVGAGWNKARARELRVAPETLTTFFVAALDALCQPGSGRDLFQILFTVEYGMDREQLETLNFYIRSSQPQLFKDELCTLPYSFRLPPGISKPAIMFSQPLLGELFGAGFTKDAKAMHYSLRFPRLTKVWRTAERNWTAGSCLEEFQKIARTSIGRESSDEWASRTVDAMWGNDDKSGPKDPRKVIESMRLWYKKLLGLQGLEDSGGTSKFYCDQRYLPSKRKAHPEDIQKFQKRRKRQSSRLAAQPLRALSSMTNVPHKSTVNWRQTRSDTHAAGLSAPMAHASLFNDQHDLPREMPDKAISNTIPTTNYMPITPDQTNQRQIVASLSTPTQDMWAQMLVTPDSGIYSEHPPSLLNLQLDGTATSSKLSPIETDMLETNVSSTSISESSWPQHYVNTSIVQFIQDAYVWIHRDSNNRRPVDRPPASHLVPQNRRIGVIYFLLIICGCRVEVEGTVYFRQSEQFTHVNKCVMFVKTGDQPEVREGLNWLFCALESWRAELNKPGNKELFVFDSEMISHTSLSIFRGDVASKALWRSSRPIEN